MLRELYEGQLVGVLYPTKDGRLKESKGTAFIVKIFQEEGHAVIWYDDKYGRVPLCNLIPKIFKDGD